MANSNGYTASNSITVTIKVSNPIVNIVDHWCPSGSDSQSETQYCNVSFGQSSRSAFQHVSI